MNKIILDKFMPWRGFVKRGKVCKMKNSVGMETGVMYAGK